MEEVTSIVSISAGEVCSVCDCEMTVSPAPDGATVLSCDCTSLLVA